MTFYTTSILALPVVILIWVLDTYLLMAAARHLLRRFSGNRAVRACRCLRQFTDPPAEAFRHWLQSRGDRAVPSWLPWLFVIAAVMVLRHVLIMIIVPTP